MRLRVGEMGVLREVGDRGPKVANGGDHWQRRIRFCLGRCLTLYPSLLRSVMDTLRGHHFSHVQPRRRVRGG